VIPSPFLKPAFPKAEILTGLSAQEFAPTDVGGYETE